MTEETTDMTVGTWPEAARNETFFVPMENPCREVTLLTPLEFLLSALIKQIPVSRPEQDPSHTPPPIRELEEALGPRHKAKPLYLAGPMTGYPGNNYAEFDRATEILNEHEWPVINAANIDRLLGFDPYVDTPDDDYMRSIIALDAVAITVCSAIIVLPGWQFSTGVRAEQFLGGWINIRLFEMSNLFPGEFPLWGTAE